MDKNVSTVDVGRMGDLLGWRDNEGWIRSVVKQKFDTFRKGGLDKQYGIELPNTDVSKMPIEEVLKWYIICQHGIDRDGIDEVLASEERYNNYVAEYGERPYPIPHADETYKKVLQGLREERGAAIGEKLSSLDPAKRVEYMDSLTDAQLKDFDHWLAVEERKLMDNQAEVGKE